MNIFIFKDKNNTSAGYVQITEDELQAYKKNSEGKVFLINLGHSIMEVDEIAYHDFYKEENREDYRQKLAIKNNVVSMESLISGEFNECNLVVDTSEIKLKGIDTMPKLLAKRNRFVSMDNEFLT